MELIPTQYKYKLPKGYSYPLGAELISKTLNGVPQYDQCIIVFHDRDEYWASEYQKRIKQGGEITIFMVYFSPTILSYHEERWEINVYALPSIHRHPAQEFLINMVLPQARVWLEKAYTSALERNNNCVSGIFNLTTKTGRIAFREHMKK